ncbi:MAG: 4-hydroxy-tetrahydrodipicolinate synthase [Candidatus Omnitrophica bacterium]|nr:4-hydroxy-tetrahydrodipicolinate synthase [Candidatus Omnitrophota bacterium]
MKAVNIKGSMVAMVTPFSAQADTIDEKKLTELVNWHIEQGTDGIVPCGTTGESPTLSFQEHERVIEIVISAARGKIPVIAGTGSNSTKEAITLTQKAQKAGANASLQVTPYYNKPTQEGLYQHFKAVADSVDIPIILYNIVGRTARNIEPETIARLCETCSNIIGVKEASGSLEQMERTKAICPKDFLLISGDDSLTLPLLSIGGVGVISVAANIVPTEVKNLCESFSKGDIEEARKLHYRLLPLIKALFIETNPIPVKTAMGILGMCEPSLRLPMCSMDLKNLEVLKQALKEHGLTK